MYFIALVLPEELNKKVLHWKNYMHEKYGCAAGLRSPAHITLIPPYWMENEKEEKLITGIENISSGIKPITVSTKNFSAFTPRTIFIDVEVTEELKKVKAAVDTYFLQADQTSKIDDRPFHPHITIATRDLHKKDFREAWSFFETKKFEAGWKANGISILRHNRVNWEVIHTADFDAGSHDVTP
jgi:2'-5' RNA ligase